VMFASRMPCAQCGASVDRAAAEGHTCDPRRWLDFQLLASRTAVAAFDSDLREFLAGKDGRFEMWLAPRGFPSVVEVRALAVLTTDVRYGVPAGR